jgi:hypothetical protein
MISLPIIIDTQDLCTQFTSITSENVDDMLNNIAKSLAVMFSDELTINAERELKSSRKRYIDNIRVIDSGKLEGTVLLDYSKDKLIQKIEEGSSAFDMKEGFLNSPKVKIGKGGGKYLTIPFRQATPGAIGESDVFAFKMSPEVYNIVKNKQTNIPVSGGGTRSAGISLNELPAHLQVKQKRQTINNKDGTTLFKAYEHKSAIAQGIAKYVDSVTGQSSYRSFRRVSEKSDPDAFIHPGIQQHNLVQKTLGEFNVASKIGQLIDNELAKLNLL